MILNTLYGAAHYRTKSICVVILSPSTFTPTSAGCARKGHPATQKYYDAMAIIVSILCW